MIFFQLEGHMRKLLCKAKRLDNQKWIKGFYVFYKKRHFIISIYGHDGDSNKRIKWIEIDSNTLCQFTGLQDKHKTMIWENDIICNQYDDGFPEKDTIAIIVWHNLGWRMKERSSIETIDESADIQNCEVIGNIFDNPELVPI